MPQITTSTVTVSHTRAPSPTSIGHVRDRSITSTSHVDNPHPTTAIHVGCTTLAAMSLINDMSLNSVHHVGDDSLSSSCLIESMSPAVVIDIGGIVKPRRLRGKTKFLFRTCEGDHLTCLCPTYSHHNNFILNTSFRFSR
jgi:hypothetical protein